jgi:hypothetical protein
VDLDGTDIELRRWQSKGTAEYADFFLSPVDQDFDNHTTALQIERGMTAAWLTRADPEHHAQDELTQNQNDDLRAHTAPQPRLAEQSRTGARIC